MVVLVPAAGRCEATAAAAIVEYGDGGNDGINGNGGNGGNGGSTGRLVDGNSGSIPTVTATLIAAGTSGNRRWPHRLGRQLRLRQRRMPESARFELT